MKKPETYQELIAIKMCETIAEYFNIHKEDLEKIFDFLVSNPNGKVIGNKQIITLVKENEIVETFYIGCKVKFSKQMNCFEISNFKFTLLKEVASGNIHGDGGSVSSDTSSGGSSSNNNNNNNNNNR